MVCERNRRIELDGVTAYLPTIGNVVRSGGVHLPDGYHAPEGTAVTMLLMSDDGKLFVEGTLTRVGWKPADGVMGGPKSRQFVVDSADVRLPGVTPEVLQRLRRTRDRPSAATNSLVPASNFMATLAVNVDNTAMSDARFREFVRRSISGVEGAVPPI